MRILHINNNYLGTTLHQLMVKRLEDIGIANKVFVPVYDKNRSVIVPDENVCVSECFKKWDRLVFDYKQTKIFNSIKLNFDVKSFDVLHAYTLFTDGNCAMKLWKEYGTPYVVAVRNTDVNDFFKLMPHLRSRGIKIMRNAKAVFFLSESYRKQVFDKYVPEKYKDELLKKVHIIPNGIDEFWLENPPETKKRWDSPEKVRLVYAGRIDKNKNIPTTQKAIKLLRQKGYQVSLSVVGKNQDQKEFDKIKQDPYTRCFEAMPKDELIYVYRTSDIFVMPSFTESFGLVYAEAMSQGLPVIYSKGQGFDGQFNDGEAGYGVCSDSPEEVAEVVLKILENYDEISDRVVKLAGKFDWKIIVKEYEKIYSSLGVE